MPKNMSFLPQDYLAKRMDRRTNLICMSLFVVVMGAVVGGYFVTDRNRTEMRQRHKEIGEKYQEAAQRIEQVNELHKRRKEMVRKAKITSVLIERVPRSVVMAELINNMPPALSLTELKMETKVVKQAPTARTALEKAKRKAKKTSLNKKEDLRSEEPAVTPTKVNLSLVGLAQTDVQVAQYMAALDRAVMFEEVNLVFSEQIKVQDEALRKFRVELTLNQDIKADELAPKRVERYLKHNPMSGSVQINASGRFVPANQPTTASAPAKQDR